MDRAAVPTDSDLRRVENIFFPEDIHKIPDVVAPEEPLPTKALASNHPMPEAKDAQPAMKDKLPEDSLSIREVVAQAKEAVLGPQAADDQPEPTQGLDLGKQCRILFVAAPFFLFYPLYFVLLMFVKQRFWISMKGVVFL